MSLAEPIIARRYFETVSKERSRIAGTPPVCVYLEVTNRCNLLCETCPRTFEALEPPGDMSWELFTSIVDQLPGLARAVLHGVGEPMMVKNLPRMIRYLKDRGVYVLFNTNGTLLAPKKRQELIDTGLDELRVSLDAADAERFFKVRGKRMFDRIVRNVGEFATLQREIGAATPRVSLWLTGLKETVDQLPDFVRLAARIGVHEVYLQRLVFDDLGRDRNLHCLRQRRQRKRQALPRRRNWATNLG
jgi:MoaA/NifB/PqqE/SkfB family radical SAM enzyme